MNKILSILLILVAIGCGNQKKTEPEGTMFYDTLNETFAFYSDDDIQLIDSTGIQIGVIEYNTSSFNVGDTLVLDENTAGALRAKRPDEIIWLNSPSDVTWVEDIPNEVVGGHIGNMHKKVEQAPVIVNDSGEITFDTIDYSSWSKRIKERLRNTPPVWSDGFKFEEMTLNRKTGHYRFKITNGSFWKLHLENVSERTFTKELYAEGTLYHERTMFVWVEKGQIIASFYPIRMENKNDILLLWKLKFTVSNEKLKM